MGVRTTEQRSEWIGAAALGVLLVAGFVLAFSWAVDFPNSVLAAAWLIAVAAMAVVLVAAFRDSRADGVGPITAVGRSFRALGRFIFWFF